MHPNESEVENKANELLSDVQLTVSVSFGSKSQKLVLDTTSPLTWVQSDNPISKGVDCEGCPEDTDSFECTGGCSIGDSP